MAHISLLRNPLRINERDEFNYSGSVIDWLQHFAPKGFGGHVYVFINGKRLEIDDWDYQLEGNDHAIVAVMPGQEIVIKAILEIIIAMAINYVVTEIFGGDTPRTPNYAETPEENTVYSLSPRQNAAKVGGVMPVIYGNVVTTPDYAAQPYLEFEVVDVDSLQGAATGFLYENPDEGELIEIYYQTIDVVEIYNLGTGEQTKTLTRISRGQSYTLPDPSEGHLWFGYRDAGKTDSFIHEISAGGYFTSEIQYRYNIESGDNREGKQYLYYLLCIGQYSHSINDILLGDVPVSVLPEDGIQYMDFEHSEHGNQMGNIALQFNQKYSLKNLFHENVITSLEVGSQELIEQEETLWYPVSHLHAINKFAVDLSFDRGFYFQLSSTGEFVATTVRFIVEWRGPSTGLRDISLTTGAANISPVRRTLHFSVPEGIGYEVRIRRISQEATATGNKQNAFRWSGLRGYGSVQYSGVYGKAHLLAMRITSSEIVSEAAQSRIRVNCTRRLWPNLGGLMNSVNPIDAIKDVMTDSVYGAGAPKSDLDLAYMSQLHTYWGGRLCDQGSYTAGFNGVFNGQTTVYEALKTILAPMHAEPLPIGGLLSVKAEGYRSFNQMVFSEANIVYNSFQMSYALPKQYDYEGLRVRYRDPDSWQVEYIAYPESEIEESARYQDFELFGCVNASHALNYASYTWAKRNTLRLSVQFTTELEGLIPQVGDRIGISHSMPSWSVSGNVINWDADTLQIVVDQDLEGYGFSANEGLLVLRSVYGDTADYLRCTLIDERTIQLPSAPVFNVYDSLTATPTLYVWGNETTTTPLRPFTITNIDHKGGVQVAISAIQFESSVFDTGMAYLYEEKP